MLSVLVVLLGVLVSIAVVLMRVLFLRVLLLRLAFVGVLGLALIGVFGFALVGVLAFVARLVFTAVTSIALSLQFPLEPNISKTTVKKLIL